MGRKGNNITGMRFGQLVAVKPTDKRMFGNIIWQCLCTCGKERFVTAADLLSKHTRSCGTCQQRGNDLTGQKFSKLLVLNRTDKRSRNRSVHWLCLCECGNTSTVSANNLQKGGTRSCGCSRSAAAVRWRYQKALLE